MINDGDLFTKWLDFNRTELEFDFGTPVAVDRYIRGSANDFEGRGPVAWTLEARVDGFDWQLIQEIDLPSGWSETTTRVKTTVGDTSGSKSFRGLLR